MISFSEIQTGILAIILVLNQLTTIIHFTNNYLSNHMVFVVKLPIVSPLQYRGNIYIKLGPTTWSKIFSCLILLAHPSIKWRAFEEISKYQGIDCVTRYGLKTSCHDTSGWCLLICICQFEVFALAYIHRTKMTHCPHH